MARGEREPNRAIRTYIEKDGPKEWAYKDMARELYRWAEVCRFYFFTPQHEMQYRLPQPLVAVQQLRHETLGAYRLRENPNGLPFEIIMNSLYLDRPQWEILETMLHEMVHLYQENAPGMEKCKNNYHNAQFVDLCEQIGLHSRLGSGAHWKAADGQFGRLMERYGVEKPRAAEVVVPPEKKKEYWWDSDRGTKKGSSTLLKWTCACEPPKNSVRTGRKDLNAVCLVCGEHFKLESTHRCR